MPSFTAIVAERAAPCSDPGGEHDAALADRPIARKPIEREGLNARIEHAVDECEKMLAGVDDEQKYKIVRGNAIRMLELDRV